MHYSCIVAVCDVTTCSHMTKKYSRYLCSSVSDIVGILKANFQGVQVASVTVCWLKLSVMVRVALTSLDLLVIDYCIVTRLNHCLSFRYSCYRKSYTSFVFCQSIGNREIFIFICPSLSLVNWAVFSLSFHRCWFTTLNQRK